MKTKIHTKMNPNENKDFKQEINSELSKLIPYDGIGQILRKVIFSHSTIDNHFGIAMTMINHMPDKADKIRDIIYRYSL